MNSENINEYIAGSSDVRSRLCKLRQAVHDAVSDVTKTDRNMPALMHSGILVQFAACTHTKHIGLYPGPETIDRFKERLDGCVTTRAGIQLPPGGPCPWIRYAISPYTETGRMQTGRPQRELPEDGNRRRSEKNFIYNYY
jgi:uncharacterized protein YdhG (YjbR/CyaY superfamily)